MYDLLIEDNTAYVVDAGGNDLLSQRAFGGELTLETVFPSSTANVTTNLEYCNCDNSYKALS